MASVANGFAEWLTEEMDKRGWQRADLAREAGIARATTSNILNGMRGAGPDACVKIAHALGVSEEEVLQRAGHLTRRPDDMSLSEWLAVGRKLTAEERADMLAWAYAKLARRDR